MLKTDINHIVTITEARGRLGELVDDVEFERFWVLTKGGKPRAALVDIEYLDYLVSLKSHPSASILLDPAKDPLLALIGSVEHGNLTGDIDVELYGE